jgi:hypothetical protein
MIVPLVRPTQFCRMIDRFKGTEIRHLLVSIFFLVYSIQGLDFENKTSFFGVRKEIFTCISGIVDSADAASVFWEKELNRVRIVSTVQHCLRGSAKAALVIFRFLANVKKNLNCFSLKNKIALSYIS